MLSALWFKFNFHISAQSGFYIDYVYKRIGEIFVRLCFIYMSQFFGEKFMIELWTRKIFFVFTQHFSKFINITKQNYFWFFFHILIISLYLLCLFFIIICFIL